MSPHEGYLRDAWDKKRMTCLACGGQVNDRDLHEAWHKELDNVTARALR